jgi:hypothetical protein
MTTESTSPFDQSGTQTDAATDNPTLEHPLIGEGKKYTTMEAALAALTSGQEHIANLEAENASLRQEEDRLKAVENTLNDIVKPKEDPLDEGKLSELVDSRITLKEKSSTMKANVAEVVTNLAAHFGGNEKAKAAYEAKAQELGMTPEAMTELSATSPKAVLAYFDVKQSTAPVTKTTGDSPEKLEASGVGEHTYAWWQNLRRTDEKQYFRRSAEMHADRANQGREKFYGT